MLRGCVVYAVFFSFNETWVTVSMKLNQGDNASPLVRTSQDGG